MENIKKRMTRLRLVNYVYQKVVRSISPLYLVRENVHGIYSRYTDSQHLIAANFRNWPTHNRVFVKTKQLINQN
ncbi:hypothetical protein IWX76_000573 [Pedobacter sp. CAN_A7]